MEPGPDERCCLLGYPAAVDTATPAIVLLAGSSVAAGFPSPADDYATKAIDLNAALIKNPQATFLMRIAGTSMRDAGVDDGDVVLVDRALRAVHGSVIIAVVDGEFTCKRLYKRGGMLKLQAANPTFPDIVPGDGQTIELWGVVTKVIKSLAKV